MDENVVYLLKLKDEISGTLQRIEQNTKGMNDTLKHSGDMVGRLKAAFFELFAIAKVIEWGKDAFNAFTEANVASAQLNATLVSTKFAAGMSRAALDENAEAISKHSLYTKTAVTSMQSVLTTFPLITAKTFPDATKAIADMSAKLGGDLQGTAIQVGKALQDPIHGITALHRVGVNFSDAQKAVIKQLMATGHAADAQRLILKELNLEFGGSAEAAAKANPMKYMASQMEEVLVKIGGSISKVMVQFIPVIQRLMGGIEPIINNVLSVFQEVMPPIIALLDPILSIFKSIFSIVTALLKPIIAQMKPALESIKNIVSYIQELFSEISPTLVAVAASVGNILGIIIRILAAVINVTIKVANWFGHLTPVKFLFETILNTIKMSFHFASALYDIIAKVLGLSSVGGMANAKDALKGEDGAAGAMGGAGAPTGVEAALSPTSAPKEAKVTNVNIDFSGTFFKLEMVTNNLNASLGQIKEKVAQVLISAVNDTNLIAGH